MKEEYIQVQCPECSSYKGQLISIEFDRDKNQYVINLLCCHCGLNYIFSLDKETTVQLGRLKPEKKMDVKPDVNSAEYKKAIDQYAKVVKNLEEDLDNTKLELIRLLPKQYGEVLEKTKIVPINFTAGAWIDFRKAHKDYTHIIFINYPLVKNYSDDELLKLILHELSHLIIGGSTVSIEDEKEVDRLADELMKYITEEKK